MPPPAGPSCRPDKLSREAKARDMDCRRELMARPVGTTEALPEDTEPQGGTTGDLPVVFPAGTTAAYQVDKGPRADTKGVCAS